MGVEGDRSWIAGKRLAVDIGAHHPVCRPDLCRAQWLVPDIEVVAEGVDALAGRLDMDDPVRSVGVQPVKALARDHEGTDRGLNDLRWWNDADAFGDDPWPAVRVDGEVGVDVVDDLFSGVAADAVDGLPLRLSARTSQECWAVAGQLVDDEQRRQDKERGDRPRREPQPAAVRLRSSARRRPTAPRLGSSPNRPIRPGLRAAGAMCAGGPLSP